MHGFSFLLIFPRWDRNRCFPSFLVVHMHDLLGRFEEMAASLCFLSGRVRLVTLSGSSSAAPEAGPRAPWPPVLSFAHMHTLPPQDQGWRRPDDKGTRFSLKLRENLCPLPMWFLCPTQDHKGCAAEHSRLHRLGWKVPDHKHTHRHTKQHPHCHFHSASLYTANCVSWHYIMAEKECHSTGME